VDIERLRRLPEEELMRLQDEEMRHRAAHYNMFLAELVHRAEIRQEERMDELTRSINRLTWVVIVATILIVILTALALIEA
jgi:type IV secretory pathway component VirB8